MNKLKTIIFLSFRSILRHKRRTFLTSSAIAGGLALTLFFISIVDGFLNKLIDDVIKMDSGHIVLEHPEYNDDPSIDFTINATPELIKNIYQKADGNIKALNLLVKGQGLLRTGYNSVGVSIYGIDRNYTIKNSDLAKNITKGDYLQDRDENKIVISEKLAKKLKIKVKKKTVLSSNNKAGTTSEDLFKIKGIFNTGSNTNDNMVHIPIDYARKFYDLNSHEVTTFGIVLRDPKKSKELITYLKQITNPKEVKVMTFEEDMPHVISYIKMERGGTIVYMSVLIFLVLFTILNTVLMSILEREKEFSTLLAIGTSYNLLKIQILFEGIIICGLGCLFGTIIAYIIYFFSKSGIDLTSLYPSEQTDVIGYNIDMFVIPILDKDTSINIIFWVFISSLMMSILPMGRINKVKLTRRG